ncbi:MAG: hypothetical protein LUD72_00050 [Bacteroidales bacterium]|nr:hypothetical protein [Bacteroidales bacterium]
MGWVDKISDQVSNLFSTTRQATPSLPSMMVDVETKQRPGLSAIALTTAVIQRLPEAGIDTGPNPDGSENQVLQVLRILVEELIQEIKDNGKITVTLSPGTIVSQGTGANAGGPVTVISQNILYAQGTGLLE